MYRTLVPAFFMMFILAGLVGPDGAVTGMVALKTMLAGVGSYIGCCLTDWISKRSRARDQGPLAR